MKWSADFNPLRAVPVAARKRFRPRFVFAALGGLKSALLICGIFCAIKAVAQSSVVVTVDAQPSGARSIPADFSGLSFETGSEMPNRNRVSGLLFCPANTQLITLFRNAGIHNLRVGGGTVDGLKAAIPSRASIDNLFAFAQAVGNLKVIYSLRLLNGDSATDAETVRYIWQHYRPLLAGFSIGNEPDWKSFHYPPLGRGTDPAIKDYPTYLARWREFAAAITHAAPGATFFGPDTGDYTKSTYWHGKSWTQRFADDEKSSGIIAAVTQHNYVGANPDNTSRVQAIENLLSSTWGIHQYHWLYEHNLALVVADGFDYRLTESNDYLGGITNASDAFASALWALDYMHWWAAHGCAGVNFHNKSWLHTDTIYLDASGNYCVYPKAYGIKAFELGSRGHCERLRIEKANGLNMTAYAVGDSNQLCVTLINKEHGESARQAHVTVLIKGFMIDAASTILLTSSGNAAATNGITLGSAPITNDAPWDGRWEKLEVPENHFTVTVPAASALIVKLESRTAGR